MAHADVVKNLLWILFFLEWHWESLVVSQRTDANTNQEPICMGEGSQKGSILHGASGDRAESKTAPAKSAGRFTCGPLKRGTSLEPIFMCLLATSSVESRVSPGCFSRSPGRLKRYVGGSPPFFVALFGVGVEGETSKHSILGDPLKI